MKALYLKEKTNSFRLQINWILIVFLFVSNIACVYAQLVAGDIAIIAFDADSDDGFSFVVLAPDGIPAGEIIYFSDDGYQSGSGLDNTEGRITWVAGAAVPAGTIVDITCANNPASGCSIATSHGSATESNQSFNLSGSGDIVLAFVGSDQNTPSRFLTLFSTEAYSTEPTDIPPGLIDGVTAIDFDTNDNQDIILHNSIMSLDCSAVSPVACSALIYSNEANFSTQDGTGDQSIDGVFPDFSADVPPSIGAAPTPVTLSAVSTERTGEKVKFDWSTSSELFNVGFQLWGLDAADSKWEKLHGWLVRSGSGNAVEPQSYTKTVRVPKTIKELTAVGISSVDNDGTEHYYGPFNVGQSYGNLNSLKPIAWNHIRAQTDAQMLARGYIKDRVHGYRKISTLSGSAASSAAGSQPFIEFKIQASGLYSITAQQLLTAGANWQDIATRDIALTDHQGKAVVRHVSAKGTGTGQARTLGAQGEIYFYAKGVNNKTGVYTDSSVYRLVIDRYKSLNPQYQGKRGISDNYSAYYREQIVLENDNQYNLASAGDDPWLDTSVLSYADQSGSYAAALAVEADAMWDQDSIVTLGLGRGSQLTPVDNDGDGIQDAEHTLEGVVLSSNGDGGLLSLGTQQATGRGEWTVDFTIPAETPVTLFDGKAVVGGVFKPGPGYAFSEVQVDSIELSYARPYVARAGDDYLAFEAPFDNASGYEVTVPNTGWPLVFAYSNGNLVRIALESQQAQTAVDGTRQRQVRFAALAGANIANAPVAYWVSGKNGLMRVNELSVKTITSKSSLLTQANHAELLVVAHPAFMTPALSNYAEFKRAQGMSVAIINYLEIVDAFGGGQPGPWALTKYLNAVHAQSSEFVHVLLVGGSSYDHTDKLGTGAMTFIPGHYAKSTYSNYTVTDTPYVTAADTNLFATIGRWPVRSHADLDTIIASSMAWSNTDHAQGSALVIAEHTVAGEGIDFAAALDGVAAQLPGSWTTDSVSVDAIRTKEPALSLSQALSKAKGQIISGLEAGPDIVMYNGHGTTSQLSNKGLFKAGDVAGIDSNGAQLWVPMSCYMTYFESTHVNTLAHQLLFSGKAVGISGAMLLSNQSENIATGKALLDSTVNQGLSIGDAVKAHKTAQSTTQLNTNLSHLGDPTLRM